MQIEMPCSNPVAKAIDGRIVNRKLASQAPQRGYATPLRRRGLALIAALALGACGDRAPPPPAAGPVEVGVVTLGTRNIRVTTELPGRTSATLTAQVRARVDGIILERAFKEGADVKAGQRLFRIDPAPYRAALASATATLMKAQANLKTLRLQAERDKVLVEGNAISPQDYDNAVAAAAQAEADVAAGRAAVDTASINLGYTDVGSPITGRIGVAQVTQGAYVQGSAATLLATVQKIDPIYVDLNQSSVEGLRLRREAASGQIKLDGADQTKVSLTLEDGTRYAQSGVLQFTDITVDQGTGTVTVRALMPNPDHVLLPGMFVRAQIDEGVSDDALLVPQVAVTHDQKGQATALVVGDDGKVVPRTLVTGRTVGAYWVVLSGLKPRERVIVEGLQKVQPGQIVKAVEASTPEGRSVSAGIVTGPAQPRPGAGAAAPATGAGTAPAPAAH
jgi:membrane fusion protein (multidrug efflux system)